MTNWLGQTASYTYDQADRLTNLNHLNGTRTSYGYDNANRLTDIQNRKSDTSAIATYQFTLDDNGNRTGIDRIEPLIPILGSIATNYTYNEKKNRLLTAGDSSFTYDLEEQLADIDGNSYAFDGQHSLISTGGATPCRYSYDGAGNRLEATRDGVITRYIYDASGNLLAEADGSNKITRYYIHGLGLLAMVTPSDKAYCYHYNATGSTIAMTDSSQQIVNKYAYTPFGIITNEVEAVPQPFKFVGQHGVMTEPNGFYYMRARYYDPRVGRFISEDPIGFGGGDVNLYVYCLNNPIRYIDPDGQFIFAPLLYFARAKAVAVGTAYLGTKIAQWAANAGGGNISNETIDQTFGKIAAINAAEVGAVGLINAGIAAGPALTSVALNPGVIQNAADFVQGFTVPGPPPPSPGGYAGLFVREVADRAGKNF